MNLTDEQQEIIASDGDIKINAVAGSGKTTTLVEYARSRPAQSRILYLAFNKSVRLESARKFARSGLNNVRAETAHSLAYRYVIKGLGYAVAPYGYSIPDVAAILGLKAGPERHREFVMANHVSRFAAFYCNSEHTRLDDLDYTTILTDPTARQFAQQHYSEIEGHTRDWLVRMDERRISCTHDYYLKKFHLLSVELPYDYILFDEGQDASPAMLAVFVRQHQATRVIVGDTHQQIYGWRFAVNSLEKTDFKPFILSRSFRFGPTIADLACRVLDWKKHLGTFAPFPIKGCAPPASGGQEKAILARSNFGLLLNAIEYTTRHSDCEKIYFEGGIQSYTFAEDGSSLYDVLNLICGRYHRVRNPLLAGMRSVAELEEYIEQTDDVGLAMMVEIIKEYGSDIAAILQRIKERHVESDKRDEAQMVFSTVHRCKGMEYDAIHLVDDFLTEQRLLRQLDKRQDKDKRKAASREQLNEEINLVYVALTRARQRVYLPVSLLPPDLPRDESIQVMLPPAVSKALASAPEGEDRVARAPFPIHELASTSYGTTEPSPARKGGWMRYLRKKSCSSSFC